MSDIEQSRFYEMKFYENELKQAAQVAISEVLRVKAGERVLIITNPHRDGQAISHALYDAVLDTGASPVLITQKVRTQLDFADEAVIKALESEPEVAISISKEKLGKDKKGMLHPYEHNGVKYEHIFNYLMAAAKMRAFWSPGVTAHMFAKTVPINYRWMQLMISKIAEIITKAEYAHITSHSGTDIVIGLKGRKAYKDDGDFSKPGSGGNLPAGEVYVSPVVGSCRGKIVFDGSVSANEGEILIHNPIKLIIEDGYISRIEGGEEAEKLRETIKQAEEKIKLMKEEGKLSAATEEEYRKNLYHIGEFG
ncbi:MAG: aminopeptidase, partial [Thermoplasmata archaeon]